MPQSLAKIYVHIVFTTKHGQLFITEEIREKLQAYMVGVVANLNSHTNEVYANPDHVHILCNLPRTITVADFISKIKTSSSKWMKTKGVVEFQWQDGYGIFSVSSSKVTVVENYIRNQAVHHKKIDYKDELRRFFKEYGIDFNEEYVWD